MNHTLIIAEAGVNHNGSLDLAKQLVDKAVDAGVDYIKFQTFKAEKLVTKSARQAEYQQRNMGSQEDSQFQMLKKLELSPEDHRILIDYCNKVGIKFFSTAFDFDSMDYLHSINLGLWKIPSGEVTNYPYLKRIAKYNEKTILSTGMCEMEDVRAAVNALYKNGLSKENLVLLHCNTEYPTPFEDVNLRAMQMMLTLTIRPIENPNPSKATMSNQLVATTRKPSQQPTARASNPRKAMTMAMVAQTGRNCQIK